MPFATDVKIKALAECGRCCCICHKFCGIKIECHHIIQEANAGPNSIDNCIPLCFDCHADMLAYDDKHPKGTKYRPEELKLHRDNWIHKVSTARPADYTEEHRKLDQSLFKHLIKIIPWNGSIGFINTNNFAGFSFNGNALDELWEFNEFRKNPECEFIDPILESVRATLAQNANHFLHLISMNTFATHNAGRFTVPPEWELEQREHFLEVVDKIHSAAGQCVESYKLLIREGRHRLAIEFPLDAVPVETPASKL